MSDQRNREFGLVWPAEAEAMIGALYPRLFPGGFRIIDDHHAIQV
jgi:hypothetical protein